MIQLSAKNNATIEIIDNRFPLGQQDTALVLIDDNIIRDKFSLINTGTCPVQYNQYSYGDFEDVCLAKKYLITELNPDCIVDIESGQGYDLSNALMLYATDNTDIGNVTLMPDNITIDSIKEDETYIFSCLVRLLEGSLTISIAEQKIEVTDTITKYDSWLKIRKEIKGSDIKNNNIGLDLFSGKCYIDNIAFFNSKYETTQTDSKLDVEIEILNPCNYDVKINQILNWYSMNCNCNKEEDNNIAILLAVPPITVVDFDSNLLCKFVIKQILPKRVAYLDNIIYNTCNLTIYESDPFILRGYVIPKAQQVLKASLVNE